MLVKAFPCCTYERRIAKLSPAGSASKMRSKRYDPQFQCLGQLVHEIVRHDVGRVDEVVEVAGAMRSSATLLRLHAHAGRVMGFPIAAMGRRSA